MISFWLFLTFQTAFASSSLTLSETQVTSYKNQGYVISDNYSNITECDSVKNKYGSQYSNYVRSDCFSYNDSYYYFICQWTLSCNISASSKMESSSDGNTTVTVTWTNTGTTIPYQEDLDTFLAKVEAQRNILNNDTQYAALLEEVASKLNTLAIKYKSDSTITSMIQYLSDWTANLQKELASTNEVNNFFCDLTNSCSNTWSTVNGVCGSSHWKKFNTQPTTNLCSAWTPSTLSGSWPWTWTCIGIKWWTSATCSANINSSSSSSSTSSSSSSSSSSSGGSSTSSSSTSSSSTSSSSSSSSTSSWGWSSVLYKGSLNGIMFLSSDSKWNITSMTPISNDKLDKTRYPFNEAECPSGYQRIGTWLRPEESWSKFYQVYTCVKIDGSTDINNAPKWTMLGILFLTSDAKGNITNMTPVSNSKLDNAHYPFNGIECPNQFQRLGIWLRRESNAYYQVYTCVKTDGSTDLNITPKWGLRWGILITAKKNGDLTSSNPTRVSNAKLDLVYYPFSWIECPTGYQRGWTWLRPEDNGTTFYQVYTCVAYSNSSQNGTNGSCGSANGSTFSSAPTSNLCSIGNASTVSGSWPWTWTCDDTSWWSTANCKAYKSWSTNTGSLIETMYLSVYDRPADSTWKKYWENQLSNPSSWVTQKTLQQAMIQSGVTLWSLNSDGSKTINYKRQLNKYKNWVRSLDTLVNAVNTKEKMSSNLYILALWQSNFAYSWEAWSLSKNGTHVYTLNLNEKWESDVTNHKSNTLSTWAGTSIFWLLWDKIMDSWLYENVYIVNIAVGWSKIDRWLKSAASTDYTLRSDDGFKYKNNKLFERVQFAQNFAKSNNFSYEYVLFHQWESDTLYKETEANYYKYLNQLSDDLIWEGISAPMFVARASYYLWDTSKNVINAQNKAIQSNPNLYEWPNTDMYGSSYRYDDVHFNKKWQTAHATDRYNTLIKEK